MQVLESADTEHTTADKTASGALLFEHKETA
jgi:hypothetical protein